MSKSDVFEAGLIALIFNNTPFTLLGDAAGILGSAAAGNLYIGLHTADVGEGGNQTTNEVAYTNYVRTPVPRTAGGWTCSGSVATNAAVVTAPTCGVTGATVTHYSIGTSPSGTGKVLYKGAIVNAPTNTLVVSNGVTPTFQPGSISTSED